MNFNKLPKLLKATVKYETKAFTNLPSWYKEVGHNVAVSTLLGVENFIKEHKVTSINLLDKLSPEIIEFWETLQDFIELEENEKLSGEAYVDMIRSHFN